MRDFTKVSPLVWRSKKFKRLEPIDRLIYLYLLTSAHSNSVGCYVLPLEYVALDLGMTPDDAIKGIERVSETLLIGFDSDEDLVLVHNFLTFNPPMNPNHAKMMQKEIGALPESRLKLIAKQLLDDQLKEKGWLNNETVSKPLSKGIGNVSAQDRTVPDRTRPDSDDGVLPLANGIRDGGYNVMFLIDENAVTRAKSKAPGWDIYHLASVYGEKIDNGERKAPDNPSAAFPEWCASYTKGKKL